MKTKKIILLGFIFLLISTAVFGLGPSKWEKGSFPSDVRYNDDKYTMIFFDYDGNGTFIAERYRWDNNSPVGELWETFYIAKYKGTYTVDGDKLTMSWTVTTTSTPYKLSLGRMRKQNTVTRTNSGTRSGTYSTDGYSLTIEGLSPFSGTYYSP